ncbi:44153_t:CDS:2 [Gigaspora margarita]|uniref:44153_t:CDS:1 n=1 Tax=Gigaspora margarita TaxID=4874 RepID=A0ABN7UMQ0_GIGMA|nr:44153_t:CDS:2 [Gigaspora margarita]
MNKRFLHESVDFLESNSNIHDNDTSISIEFEPPPKKARKANNHYDELLLKAWIMPNIPFEVVENSLIRNLFKAHNIAYVLPSRMTLSGRLLDKEFAHAQNSIDNELKNAEYLTLELILS